MPHTSLIRVALLGLSSAALLSSGCNKSNDPSAAATEHDHAHDHDHTDHVHAHADDAALTDDLSTPHTYENIRGVIVSMPVAGADGAGFQIRHEHIPAFRTNDGTINVSPDNIPGMKAMQMPFPVGEGVSLDGFAVGDKIRFTFVVNWGGSPRWAVTDIVKLADDTELDFSNKVIDAPELPEEAPAEMPDHDDHSGHDHNEP